MSQPSVATIFETMEYGPAPESPATAKEWLAAHAPHLGHFIGGEWHAPRGGDYFASVNPATAKPLIDIAQGTIEDVDAAVRAARGAFPAMERDAGPCARTVSLCDCPAHSKALTPARRA